MSPAARRAWQSRPRHWRVASPDVVALQEITDTTLPLWRAVLERIGLPHIRASLDTADPARTPAQRRRTGVLLGSSEALRDPSATLPVPWAETAVAAVAATAIGPIEIHCLHVPNAANGWVKPDTLKAVRAGLEVAPALARVVCGDLNIPRRELESGERWQPFRLSKRPFGQCPREHSNLRPAA
jgi:endonuclease/exonuclease/phosphatase family metal-dependent hydrolase